MNSWITKLMLTLVLSLLVAVKPTLASEPVSAEVVNDFMNKTRVVLASCQLRAKVKLMSRDNGLAPSSSDKEAISTCVKDYKEEIAKEYTPIKEGLSENQGALTMLKDFYAFWLSSMDAVDGAFGQTTYSFNEDADTQDKGLVERANKVRVEL